VTAPAEDRRPEPAPTGIRRGPFVVRNPRVRRSNRESWRRGNHRACSPSQEDRPRGAPGEPLRRRRSMRHPEEYDYVLQLQLVSKLIIALSFRPDGLCFIGRSLRVGWPVPGPR
jgi:hypothetical protein